MREVRLLQSLRHMNVVTLLEVRGLCPESTRRRDSGSFARDPLLATHSSLQQQVFGGLKQSQRRSCAATQRRASSSTFCVRARGGRKRKTRPAWKKT